MSVAGFIFRVAAAIVALVSAILLIAFACAWLATTPWPWLSLVVFVLGTTALATVIIWWIHTKAVQS